ncbi:acyl-CoA dehydrogenase family protein [Micromonospora globbae]|uniref:acyl-CoA dehydrogenase family protein n=1 Tax=Micromonospora globbae TaxID=1894969 RepID=UPI00386A403C|nr:acyl-CoA dehydrogenase family protein [Micromonospora globbae]
MDLGLSAEQAAVRRLAAEFVDREVRPHAAEWDRRESVDPAIVGLLGDLGFLGLTIPESDGGSGGDHLTYCLVLEELGRGDSAVRGIVSVSLGLVAASIARHGSAEQRAHWLPRLCSGAALGCFALTEPDSGSDAAALATRAVRDGGDWLLTGTKTFITNGTTADVALVFARTGEPGHRGITAFLVPTDSPGLARREIHGKLGLRGQATGELRFDGVRVPDSARLGEEGGGFRLAMATLAKGRMSVAAGCVGIAQGCLDAAVAYAAQRTQFGKPIAGHQLVQQMIAAIAVDTAAARLLVWQVADVLDRGEPYATEASMAKLFASEAAVRAANNAVQVFGGYGYIDEYPVGRYLRDARVTTLYEGTSQIQQLLIGRALTGVSAF